MLKLMPYEPYEIDALESWLEDMARKAPTTLEAFAKVNGVGSVKVKRFGEVFVDAIADYLQEHGG